MKEGRRMRYQVVEPSLKFGSYGAEACIMILDPGTNNDEEIERILNTAHEVGAVIWDDAAGHAETQYVFALPGKTQTKYRKDDLVRELNGVKRGKKEAKASKDETPAGFVNPEAFWEYEGAYSIELTTDAAKGNMPRSIVYEGDMAFVARGQIKLNTGSFQFRSEVEPFYCAFRYMKAIRDGQGKLLWVNNRYRKQGRQS